MPQRFVRTIVATTFVLINLPALGAQNNGTGPDAAALCAVAQDVCFKACRRSKSFSGWLSEELCKDECVNNGNKCRATIPTRSKNKGSTGVGSKPKPFAQER